MTIQCEVCHTAGARGYTVKLKNVLIRKALCNFDWILFETV